jgi:hypothetical protein
MEASEKGYKWLSEAEHAEMMELDYELFDEPNKNFARGTNVHPAEIMGCWVLRKDGDKERNVLKECEGFSDEGDDGLSNILHCDYCYANGYYGLCERALIQPIK